MSQVVVSLNKVSLKRGQRFILKDISWEIKKGQHWAVVGSNGAGKTSLLKIVAGYLWPTQGQVNVLGQTYGRCDLRQLRSLIGWVSDDLRDKLYPQETVLEVVISGKYGSIGLWNEPTKDEIQTAWQLLERLDIAHIANKALKNLSQGERQRVLMARALMAKPLLLILDEPFSGLDLKAREKTLLSLNHIAKLSTLILITHHIEEIMPIFSHVLVLKNGQILSQGPKSKVLTDEILSQAFNLPLKIHQQFGRFWPLVNWSYSTKSSQSE